MVTRRRDGAIRSTEVIGESLSSHDNSLNFLRVVLASTVLLSHAASIGGFGSWAGLVNGSSAAQIALYGFFGISGYLIAQSAIRSTPGRYLWKRVLRIFPALIICLLVTAFVFGIVAWLHDTAHHCGLSCYFNAPDGPVTYVVKNALLSNPFWTQHTIAGIPTDYLANWNASIWTLFFEFACYLVVLFFGIIGFLRHRVLTLASLLVMWVTMTMVTVTPALSRHFTFFTHLALEEMIRFIVLFLTGSVMFLYRDRIPDSGWLALCSALLYVIAVVFPLWTLGKTPTAEFTPIDIGAPFIVSPVLWLGIHLPFHRVGAKNDYSYGIYIYGWPIAQLLITWNLMRFGLVSFEFFAIAATIPFAIASWWIIERPSLKMKSLSYRRSSVRRPVSDTRPAAEPSE